MTMGWDGNNISDLSGLGSAEFSAVVEKEFYEGKEQTKVQWINRLQDTFQLKSKMDQGQRIAFAEKMKGKSMAIKQKQPVNGIDDDDSIPF